MYMVKPTILTHVPADQYLTVEEAAREMKVKPQTVRNGLATGTFTTYKFKTLTLLSASEIREYKMRVANGK